MKLNDPADLLFLPFGRVVYLTANFQDSGINPDKSQIADKGIRNNFKNQSAEILRLTCLAGLNLIIAVEALYRRHIQRRRQIGNDCIKQGLYPFVLKSTAAEDRYQLQLER